MPVTFYIDPAILEDELANEVQTITLSYTFYRTLDDIPDEEPEIISEADQVITTAQVGSF
jgi:cytochrome c oxidase assembly protein subunit 11